MAKIMNRKKYLTTMTSSISKHYNSEVVLDFKDFTRLHFLFNVFQLGFFPVDWEIDTMCIFNW